MPSRTITLLLRCHQVQNEGPRQLPEFGINIPHRAKTALERTPARDFDQQSIAELCVIGQHRRIGWPLRQIRNFARWYGCAQRALVMQPGDIQPGEISRLTQVLQPWLAERIVQQIEIVMDGFFTITNHHQIDEIGQGFRIDIGNRPAYQDKRVGLIALGR